jgi:hypothetical protein
MAAHEAVTSSRSERKSSFASEAEARRLRCMRREQPLPGKGMQGKTGRRAGLDSKLAADEQESPQRTPTRFVLC